MFLYILLMFFILKGHCERASYSPFEGQVSVVAAATADNEDVEFLNVDKYQRDHPGTTIYYADSGLVSKSFDCCVFEEFYVFF